MKLTHRRADCTELGQSKEHERADKAGRSRKTAALATFVDCKQELLAPHLVGRILRQVDLVETYLAVSPYSVNKSCHTHRYAPVASDPHHHTRGELRSAVYPERLGDR